MIHDENVSRLLNIDPRTIESLLLTALSGSFTSIMISRAEEGNPVIYVNPAFTELTGYSGDEMIGKSPSILQGPKTDLSVIDRLRHDLANGRIFHGKTVNYRKDGSEFLMEWKIFPIMDENQKSSLFLAVQRRAENGAVEN